MSPHESTQLTELTEEVRAMRADLRVMHTKLFGDDDKETDQGRIPRLEAKVSAHGRIIERWKPVHFVLRGAWIALVGIAGYLLNNYLPHKGH